MIAPDGISREALLYLFADRLVERSRLAGRLLSNPACPVPGGQRLVKLGSLEQMLCAWALWGLEDGGYIKLEVVDPATAWNAFRQKVTGTGATQPWVRLAKLVEAPPGPSLSAELATLVPENGGTVLATLLDWAIPRTPLPLFGIVKIVRAEATRAGILQSGLVHPPWWRRSWFNQVLASSRPNAERLFSLNPHFEQLRQEWLDFGAAHHALRAGLLRDVGNGLAAARPTSFDPSAPS